MNPFGTRLDAASTALSLALGITTSQTRPTDIVSTARGSGFLFRFVEAIEQARLVQMLGDEGPFTVFAPSDDAFAIGDSDGARSCESLLATTLANHVVAGRWDVTRLPEELETLGGRRLRVTRDDGLRINQAGVIRSDIQASNGSIHIIDRIMAC
jgi:uncharacterized surface protein with fasciclin (FAS1) repeats